jgi:hypothetical protein
MGTFIKAAAGGFVGKLLATLFIAACVAVSFGPDRWVSFIIDGAPSFLTPSNARAMFLVAAIIITLLLLMSLFQSAPSNPSIAASQIEYGLSVTGIVLFADKLGKRKRNIQVGVGLKNVTPYILRYDVDYMFVSVNDVAIDEPKFSNNGLVLRPGETDVFRYAPFKDQNFPPESNVIISINISYGPPDGAFIRHLKREYSGVLRVTATSQSLTTIISGEDWDEPI